MLTAIRKGLIGPIKNAERITVNVAGDWWQNMSNEKRNLILAAPECAVAGPSKRLGHLRIASGKHGVVLFE